MLTFITKCLVLLNLFLVNINTHHCGNDSYLTTRIEEMIYSDVSNYENLFFLYDDNNQIKHLDSIIAENNPQKKYETTKDYPFEFNKINNSIEYKEDSFSTKNELSDDLEELDTREMKFFKEDTTENYSDISSICAIYLQNDFEEATQSVQTLNEDDISSSQNEKMQVDYQALPDMNSEMNISYVNHNIAINQTTNNEAEKDKIFSEILNEAITKAYATNLLTENDTLYELINISHQENMCREEFTPAVIHEQAIIGQVQNTNAEGQDVFIVQNNQSTNDDRSHTESFDNCNIQSDSSKDNPIDKYSK